MQDNAARSAAISLKLANEADLPALKMLMHDAIHRLQADFLTPAQIMASSAFMGLDRQLVVDRTYFLATIDGALAGCGGWSRRATLYGGDHSAGLREPRLLDPASEPARMRAMYTSPSHTRRGVGRAILAECERSAQAEGYAAAELMATMSGLPLYLAAGYAVIEELSDDRGGTPVPLCCMRKSL